MLSNIVTPETVQNTLAKENFLEVENCELFIDSKVHISTGRKSKCFFFRIENEYVTKSQTCKKIQIQKQKNKITRVYKNSAQSG